MELLKNNKILQKISKTEENSQKSELEIIKSNANSIKAVALIRSYRQRGHLIAKLDPLGLIKSDYLDELTSRVLWFQKR